jgi:mannose-6-phosphate isomerase-like protein (cupin superfamily)
MVEGVEARWGVVNLTETRWRRLPGLGTGTRPEHPDLWEQIGITVRVLGPGEALAMYHREEDQEDFLLLSGEATLVVEGEARRLRAWDFFHCPAGTAHSIIGGPCVVLALGARGHEIRTGTGWGVYPVDAVAIAHGVGVEHETDDPDVAYARFGETETVPYGGWLG